MLRNWVFEEAAADPSDGGGSGGGGAAQVIGDGAGSGNSDGENASEGLPEWAVGVPSEQAAMIREAKWETPQQMAQSHHALLSLKGAPADRLLKLPGSPTSDESKAYLDQMRGVPGAAADYNLDAVQVPEGVVDIRDAMREALHASRVPGELASGLVQSVQEAMLAKQDEQETENDAKFATAKAALESKWAGESPQKWANVQKAYSLIGVSDAVADKIALGNEGGPEEFFMRLEEMGRRMGEPTDHGKTAGAAGGSGFITAAAAEAKLEEIKSDPTKNPNDPSVRREIDRLAMIARPEKIRL